MIIKAKNKLKLKTRSKILVLGLILFSIIGFFTSTTKTQAQTPPNCVYGTDGFATNAPCVRPSGTLHDAYHFLAPLPCVSSPGITCTNGVLDSFDFSPANPQENSLSRYINLLIKLIIGIAAVLAVVMIVIGGIEYMTTELISGKEAGKERITHAVLGLLLALGAYALLNTINPDLLGTDVNINAVTVQVKIDLEADVPQTYDPTTRKYPNGTAYGVAWVGTATPLPAGVTINASQCSTVGQQNCTSTIGLDLASINIIKSKCTACTNLVITGGTESWLHGGKSGNTSHYTGSPTVDIRPTPELTQYITGGKPLVRFTRYTNGDGLSYLYEGNHWHVGP